MNTYFSDDTIAALSTAPGPSSLSIVRISGKDSRKIITSILHDDGLRFLRDDLRYTCFSSTIQTADCDLNCRIYQIPGPHSYTREDMYEIHILSSPMLAQIVLREMIQQGARLALPGEFTFRAHINGRIDLTQAEGILQIINASHTNEQVSGMQLLESKLSSQLQYSEDMLYHLISDIEASLDFTDRDIQFVNREHLISHIQNARISLEHILHNSEHQHTQDHRPALLLFGPSNAGKSTLFNRLVDSAEVLVSDQEGTTRDLIHGIWNTSNRSYTITDSAGLHVRASGADHHAIQMTKRAIHESDLILLLVETNNFTQLKHFRSLITDRPYIIVFNKSDIHPFSEEHAYHDSVPFVHLSAKEGTGIELLSKTTETVLSHVRPTRLAGRIHMREQWTQSLHHAVIGLKKAHNMAVDLADFELIAYELTVVLQCIGDITGKQVSDEILTTIFSRFCIGK